MKSIDRPAARNPVTATTLAELHAWLDRYFSDNTDAFAIVLCNRAGAKVNVEHKTAATPETIHRKMLAHIAYRAIIGEQATVDHVADDAMGRALTKWDADG